MERYYNILPKAMIKRCKELGRAYLKKDEASKIIQSTPGSDLYLMKPGTTIDEIYEKLERFDKIRVANSVLEGEIIIPLKDERD